MYAVSNIFSSSADAQPFTPFLCIPPREQRDYLPSGAEFSYGQVSASIARLQARYAAAGFGHGHRVGLLLENRPDFIVHWLALNAIGSSIMPINPAYRADEIAYMLSHGEPDLIVSLPARPELDLALRSQDRRIPLMTVAGDDLAESVTSIPRAERAPPLSGLPSPLTEAALLYTSGTTARPKGCILSNEYVVTTGRWYASRGGEASYRFGTERLYSPLPLFHMAGLTLTTMAMMLTGGCLIVPERFNSRHAWTDMVGCRASVLHYLGVIVASLLGQPETPEERQHGLHFSMGVGANPDLRARATARFGIPFVEGWGMTETGRSCFNTVEPRHLESNTIGRSEPGFELKILDGANREVPAGTVGELCARFSPDNPRKGFFSGYLKNPEATEEAWRGGWFHTGDSAWQHEDGAIVFVDRLKHLIRRAGENISAAEVEGVINLAPGVRQSAVVSGHDPVRQEEVVAFVTAEAPATLEMAQNVFFFCAERLAYYKVPAWIAFVEALPMTSTNKIQKHALLGPDKDPASWPDIFDLRSQKSKLAKQG
ncbi:MAG: AMP-binding protein [Bradyrhizobium sp.]|uniref:AMP-binding protein n=1 Tax=Bradyrhizobium sp. TaxID=376 RepID=UPI0025C32673|nr:AMP-binding protein [Bradyrhizobium sp.]MBI5263961.1 AMP-binding protein [Bradyrhizobium sp.]